MSQPEATMTDQHSKKKGTQNDKGWAGTNRRVLPNLLEHGMAEELLELLSDGIIVHDEKRRLLLVNRSAELITGRDRESLLGRDCHRIFSEVGLCGGACAFGDGQEINNVPREHEVAFLRPDGEVKKARVKSTPVMLNQRARGVLVTIRDLTELEDLQYRLDKRREFHGMIGVSRSIGDIFETIRAVGPSDYPVLISGESGTGKELVAGAIHKESRRKSGPFVPVNCGALPENILESELFGHVRGAFTGAIRDKKGRFELANGGTIFLDEVGELPLHMQAKLLRVLQQSAFERVGGEKSVQVDIRIIAATNRDLKEMVQEGAFREDLFYRLCVVPIDLPPLRERTEDIPYITASILEKVRSETGKDINAIGEEAMSLLMGHPWRGNVRELINALQFASVLCRGNTILAEHLPLEIREPPESAWSALPVRSPGRTSPAPVGMVETKKRRKLTPESVRDALAQTGGNRLKAAKLLGVGRATLYRFFDDHPNIV
jgi:PAS domain S-box-containing protein